MPQNQANVELKSFSAGIISDLSPLSADISTTSELINWYIDKDGSVSVRDGVEKGTSNVVTTPTDFGSPFVDSAPDIYVWEQVENADFEVIVSYSGSGLILFRRDGTDGITSVQGTFTGGYADADFTTVAGQLLITGRVGVTPTGSVDTVRYDGTNFLRATRAIEINDFFGVDDNYDMVTGTTYNNIIRVPDLTPRNYNLMNQGFTPEQHQSFDFFGSNRVNRTSIPSTGFTSVEVFDGSLLTKFDKKNGRNLAPMGKANINICDRSDSREDFIDLVGTAWDGTGTIPTDGVYFKPANFTADSHIDGDIKLAAHQGRVFYGFVGWELVGGDKDSPLINDMICFSQSVTKIERVGKCHTVGDLTSFEGAPQSDADGGFISISGLGAVIKFISTGPSLIVFTDTGVWDIGSADGVFKGTTYTVNKVTTDAVLDVRTIVQHNESISYMASSGYNVITPDSRSGRYNVVSLSDGKIAAKYKSDYRSRIKHSTVYDEVDDKLYWFYGSRVRQGQPTLSAVVYDLLTGAFLEHDYPLTEVPSSNISAFIDVGSTEADNNVGIKGIFIELDGFDATFWDYSYTEKPLTSDVVATLNTNVSTFGDATKRKFCNYLTAYLKQTEQTQDANGLLDQSSCKVRVAWDFADSIASNKYSSEFQAYRLRRINVSETSSPSETIMICSAAILTLSSSIDLEYFRDIPSCQGNIPN